MNTGRDGSLDLYLREIAEVPLLTPAEEHELAVRIADGDVEARERMIRANLRLVVAVAKRYARRGLPLADLIEEGNVGLLRAVERYDPGSDARFATYATWWIKQAIRRALTDKVRTVRLPAYMVDIVARFKREAVDMEEKLGRRPTVGEVAAGFDPPFENIALLKRALELSEGGARAISIDAMVGGGSLLLDRRSATPSEAVLGDDIAERLQGLLDRIDPRDAEILRLRYGLHEDGPLPLREIGARLGISHERVRQLEMRALRGLADELGGGAAPA